MDNQTLLSKPVVGCRPDGWTPSLTDTVLVRSGDSDCGYWVELSLLEYWMDAIRPLIDQGP